MGVAPYSWPQQREWTPGTYDKRANLGIYFILIIYSIFYIGLTLNIGMNSLLNEWFAVFLFMTAIMVGVIVFFILGQTSRRDVKVEEVKYFDVQPDRLSELVLEVLSERSIAHHRDGPRVPNEDYWIDTFHLLRQPWKGISLEVERNPLIARVDVASVTVRGKSRSMEQVNIMEEHIDGAVMKELLARYEQEMREDPPELVLFGDSETQN